MTELEAEKQMAEVEAELRALEASPAGRLVEAYRRSDELEAMQIDIQRVDAGGAQPVGWPNRYGPAMPRWMKDRRDAQRQRGAETNMPHERKTDGT